MLHTENMIDTIAYCILCAVSVMSLISNFTPMKKCTNCFTAERQQCGDIPKQAWFCRQDILSKALSWLTIEKGWKRKSRDNFLVILTQRCEEDQKGTYQLSTCMMQVAPPSTKYDKVIGLKRSSKLHTKARNTQNITKLLHSLCQIAPELVQATWSSL